MLRAPLVPGHEGFVVAEAGSTQKERLARVREVTGAPGHPQALSRPRRSRTPRMILT
jgi:hypothetical protein